MNKIYNTQEDIASEISKFLKNVDAKIRKTQLNIIPYIIIGMISAESTVSIDIAKNLKGKFSLVQIDSITKRIKRLYNNKYFNPYDLYDKVIKHIISSFKIKHKDNRVHIIFDHMYSKDHYTIFMISMRIGKQSIPLWFRCYEGYNNPEAFNNNLLKEGILYVSNLFKDKKCDLIFLADRGFNNLNIYEYINSLGHTYVIRSKNFYRILIYDKRIKYGKL